MNRIAVWNTAFLGDAVLTLPLIRTLKASFPEAGIHYWVRGGLEGLFAAQPELEAVHGFDKRGSQKGFWAAVAQGRRLADMGYTLWISPHVSLRSAMMARWSSAKVRVGYNAPLYNRYAYTHTVSRRFGELEEVERVLELARPLGVEHFLTWPELALTSQAQDRARDVFEALGPKGPWLGVHPGSTWETKRWPPERMGRVAAWAAAKGSRVLVFGGPGEESLAREVLDAAHRELTPDPAARARLENLAGRLDLPQLAAVLGRLDCYLSNDAGPMHLAWVQRTPVVAVFGPTVRSLGFYPRGEGAVVVEREEPCRPCGLHGGRTCPQGGHACMEAVTAEEVWGHVAERLGLAP